MAAGVFLHRTVESGCDFVKIDSFEGLHEFLFGRRPGENACFYVLCGSNPSLEQVRAVYKSLMALKNVQTSGDSSLSRSARAQGVICNLC